MKYTLQSLLIAIVFMAIVFALARVGWLFGGIAAITSLVVSHKARFLPAELRVVVSIIASVILTELALAAAVAWQMHRLGQSPGTLHEFWSAVTFSVILCGALASSVAILITGIHAVAFGEQEN